MGSQSNAQLFFFPLPLYPHLFSCIVHRLSANSCSLLSSLSVFSSRLAHQAAALTGSNLAILNMRVTNLIL